MHLETTLQVVPLMSPERGFPMQKVCTALMVKSDGRVLAAGSDGCCYVLDAESLQQDARHILHPSQTGYTLHLFMRFAVHIFHGALAFSPFAWIG